MATTNGSTAIRDKILASLARYRALRIGKFPCAFWRLSAHPGLTAEEFTTETPLLTIGNEQMLAANIGSYVIIRQASIAVLAMVFKMREEDRFEQGARLSDRFFSLIPVGELKAEVS